MNRWLMKSEPEELSYGDLERKGLAGWDGVRNFQARNFLRQMAVGDLVLFYHSSTVPPGVAGVARVATTAEPDPTQFDSTSHSFDPASSREDPRWDWVQVAPVRALRYVTLAELRTIPEMHASRLLARGNRLSVMPMTDEEFDAVVDRADRG